jgi:Mrp family chromosome partitioning ATPase
MKLLLLTYLLGCLFALTVFAIAPQKAVVVTYPEDTPDSVMDQAKDTIRKAGGIITHDYKIIK